MARKERSRRSTRKWCKVWRMDTVVDENGEVQSVQTVRCDAKIKPGTPFCKEHFETHTLVEQKCTGDAHGQRCEEHDVEGTPFPHDCKKCRPGNPFIDNCGCCMPYWGRYPVAVAKKDLTPKMKLWTREDYE